MSYGKDPAIRSVNGRCLVFVGRLSSIVENVHSSNNKNYYNSRPLMMAEEAQVLAERGGIGSQDVEVEALYLFRDTHSSQTNVVSPYYHIIDMSI